MALTLRISSKPEGAQHVRNECVLDGRNGSIGRADTNDLIIDDPTRIVSGTHAQIVFRDDRYYVRDTSMNGTHVNDVALGRGDEHRLKPGDRIRAGEFVMDVLIDSGVSAPVNEPLNPPGALFGDEASFDDPLDLLNGDNATPPRPTPAQPDHAPPEAASFAPPPLVTDPSMPDFGSTVAKDPIPEDWLNPVETPADPAPSGSAVDDLLASDSTPSPEPAVTPPGSPAHEASTANTSIGELLASAGLDPSSVDPKTSALLGQILSVVIGGTVEVLQARKNIKSEFRLQSTLMRPAENNPLKLSVNAQDALQNLFGKSNPGFLSPVEAFREGFEDIKAHQLAMIAGMRAAFAVMLDQFDPKLLEQDFDKRLNRSALMGIMNKSKYWELYEEKYASLRDDDDAAYDSLFGKAFGEAYEDQIRRLESMRD